MRAVDISLMGLLHIPEKKAEVKMLELLYFVHEGGDSDFCANMSP